MREAMSRRLVDGKLPARSASAAKGGRPPLLEVSPEIEEKILQACRMGAHVTTAAAWAGVEYDTFRTWVIKGHENPESIYGALIGKINKALAEWEMGDLSVLHAHTHGRPAKYLKKPVVDRKGKILLDDKGKPIMEPVLTKDGQPILEQSEIRSDWRAAIERMQRRKPRNWARRDQVSSERETDPILTFDNKKPETKEALSFDERIARAVEQLEDDV